MTREELIEKYFTPCDIPDIDMPNMYMPKDEYVIQLDLFTPDYISSIEGDMMYSMASDNKYSLREIGMDCIKIFKRVE